MWFQRHGWFGSDYRVTCRRLRATPRAPGEHQFGPGALKPTPGKPPWPVCRGGSPSCPRFPICLVLLVSHTHRLIRRRRDYSLGSRLLGSSPILHRSSAHREYRIATCVQIYLGGRIRNTLSPLTHRHHTSYEDPLGRLPGAGCGRDPPRGSGQHSCGAKR